MRYVVAFIIIFCVGYLFLSDTDVQIAETVDEVHIVEPSTEIVETIIDVLDPSDEVSTYVNEWKESVSHIYIMEGPDDFVDNEITVIFAWWKNGPSVNAQQLRSAMAAVGIPSGTPLTVCLGCDDYDFSGYTEITLDPDAGGSAWWDGNRAYITVDSMNLLFRVRLLEVLYHELFHIREFLLQEEDQHYSAYTVGLIAASVFDTRRPGYDGYVSRWNLSTSKAVIELRLRGYQPIGIDEYNQWAERIRSGGDPFIQQ